jgi:chromosomal replication initiation ATPase DnaA
MSRYYAVHFCYLDTWRINPELLLDKVSDLTGISVEEMKKSRKRECADAKICFALLCMKFFPKISSVKLGMLISKNHSTILHYKKVKSQEKEIKELLTELELKLNENTNRPL